MIKLIATDLDNTLLDRDGLVPEETAALIRRAVDGGAVFAVSTGRSVRSAQGIAESTGAAYMVICYNGALVLDPVNGVVIHQDYLPEETVRALVRFAHENGIYIQMYDEGTIVTEKLSARIHPDPDLGFTDSREVADLLEHPFIRTPKVLMACEPERVKGVQESLRAIFGDSIYVAQSEPYLIEIMSPGTDKGYGLELLAAYLGFSRDEVIAFGDNTNDLPLLRAAGTGVAVANSVEALKKEADYVTKLERSEGFCEGLRRYMPGLGDE